MCPKVVRVVISKEREDGSSPETRSAEHYIAYQLVVSLPDECDVYWAGIMQQSGALESDRLEHNAPDGYP